jgi:hypothetical protein
MRGVAQMPRVAEASAAELEALSAFVEHCAVHHVAAPGIADLRAHLHLAEPALLQIETLASALDVLGFEGALVEAARSASADWSHRTRFRGYNHHGESRGRRVRRVSVAPDRLPSDWRETLRVLRRDRTYSTDIVTRMEHRLCMFAWSAAEAGLPADLEGAAAECALYDDMIQRSRARAAGECEDGSPRWA